VLQILCQTEQINTQVNTNNNNNNNLVQV